MGAGQLYRNAMSDRRIQVFRAVAKHLSFTKAAEVLFMSQPAVTFQVRQLEEQLDARLFDRTPRGIALTSAGAVALEYADRMFAMSAELKTRVKEMSGRIGGQLLVGASTAYADLLLPQVLAEFKSRYPSVVPRLVVANSETVQARLLDRTFTIGFIEGGSLQPALKTELCCGDELQLVCPPSHPLAREEFATAESLARYPYVNRESGSGTRHAVDRYLQDCGMSPGVLQVVMEASCPEAVKALVAAGIGISVMSRTRVLREVKLGELRSVPLSPRLACPLLAVYPKERFHSRLVSSFLGFARERIAALLAAENARHVPDRGADPRATATRARSRGRTGAQAAPRS
jgi:DNA-binding transcriptional LysR family regulator